MRVVVPSVIGLFLLCSQVWAVEPAPSAATLAQPATTAASTPPPLSNVKKTTPEQTKLQQDAQVKALVKDQAQRLQQLEKANLDALSQNQELQLKNDNMTVQLQVLQSERSAQMFLYGATTLAVGVLLGFLIASYIYTKRRRQW